MNKLKKNRKSRLCRILLAGMLTTLLMAQPLSSYAANELSALTLSVVSSSTQKEVPGVEMSVYRVAAKDAGGIYRLTPDFNSSGLKIEELTDAQKIRENAEKLEKYIAKEAILPNESKETNQEGNSEFTGLQEGIYLVSLTGTPGTKLKVEATPFFIVLPQSKEDGTWNYEVVAKPKVTTSETIAPTTPEESSAPEESSEPDESKAPDESKDPNESTADETKDPSESTGQPETETTHASDQTTAPEPSNSNGGGNHNHGGGGGNSGGGSGTTTIEDNPTPLASFPQTPEEPKLTEIEDVPVPLGNFPIIPRLGDMGTAGAVIGMILSLGLGGTTFFVRKRFDEREDD